MSSFELSGKVALVTGARTGIGIELCRQLLAGGATVVGSPRVRGAVELDRMAAVDPERLHIVAMDIGNDASVTAAAREIGRRVERIDLLFNNAGIYPKDGGIEGIEPSKLLDAFNVNAVGPLRVVRALLPLLRKGEDKRLIQTTSLMGSIADNTSGGSYAYRMSKTALNMAVRNLAHELGPEGFICMTLHPGWVQTKMGGPAAPAELGPAVSDLLRTALRASPPDNGTFKGPGAEPLPY